MDYYKSHCDPVVEETEERAKVYAKCKSTISALTPDETRVDGPWRAHTINE